MRPLRPDFSKGSTIALCAAASASILFLVGSAYAADAQPTVRFQQEPGKLTITVAGRPVATYVPELTCNLLHRLDRLVGLHRRIDQKRPPANMAVDG